ncbi:50S ribosomal protein L23, partial [Flavobacteriaceae bacterium]|nr:50S ribosomal protein L23 [Flavobacteriaceae bacterium]
ANKIEIKKAVETAYGVSISSVKTLNYPVQKNTKFTKKGLVTGKKGAYKKAIIQLAEGESIDFYNNL